MNCKIQELEAGIEVEVRDESESESGLVENWRRKVSLAQTLAETEVLLGSEPLSFGPAILFLLGILQQSLYSVPGQLAILDLLLETHDETTVLQCRASGGARAQERV
jgi:hypothetical protein